MMAHSGNVVGGRDATENTLTHRNTKSPRDDSEGSVGSAVVLSVDWSLSSGVEQLRTVTYRQ